MSWIKDNKFVVALGGGTLVGAILIFMAGSKGATRYQQAKDDFDATSAEALQFENRPLYPRLENRDGKGKALDEYRQATETLQKVFEPYRPKELKNVSPQDFTNQLKAVNEEVRKACEDAGTKVPEPFFCGFENYKNSLAPGNATGILDYELTTIKELIFALAKSGATELQNFHRAPLPEEDGREYKPGNFEVARSLPFEITFSGPEKSVRAFLSAVLKQEGHYVVIRAISVANSKKEPPRSTDAKFDKPATPPPTAPDGIFNGGGFVLPPSEAPTTPPATTPKTPPTTPPATAPATPPATAPATPPATAPATPPATAPATPPAATQTTPTASPATSPATPAATPTTPPAATPTTPPAAIPGATPAPVSATGDSSRILSQVLGNEDVQVFLRLDLMPFLPVQKLP